MLLEPDSFARVVTDNLRVRSKPGVGEDSIRFEPLLDSGFLAFVLEGPVRSSGYDWYRIAPLGYGSDVEPDRAGWFKVKDRTWYEREAWRLAR